MPGETAEAGGATVRVGIVIPTYNRLPYLRRALSSALTQTHQDVAVLVLDNGSIDGTRAHLAAIRDPRVRVVLNESNLGAIGSIRKGISGFEGQDCWCTVLCDDDALEPRFLEKALQAAERCGATAVVNGHRILIDREGRELRETPPSPAEESAAGYLRARRDRKRETWLTGILFRTDAYRRIGGYPAFATGIATDDAFLFSLALLDRLVFEREAVARITIHPDAESESPADAEHHFRALAEFEEYVVRAASELGGMPPLVIGELREITREYVTRLDSEIWIRAVNALSRKQGEEAREEIRRLCTTAADGLFPFTPRVRTGARILRFTGWYPERFRPYRSFWKRFERRLSGPR
jgi:glycosyltransferase involved in cell wall biosynthesis